MAKFVRNGKALSDRSLVAINANHYLFVLSVEKAIDVVIVT